MDVMWGFGWEPGFPEGNADILCDLLRETAKRGFIPDEGLVLVNERRKDRFTAAVQIAEKCAGWQKATYRVVPSQRTQDYDLSVNVWPETVRLDLHLSGSQLDRRRSSLITTPVAVMRQVVEKYKDAVRFGARCSVSVRNLPYPRVRPPKTWPVVDTATVVDLFDVRFETQRGAGDAAQRLSTHPVPAFAVRDQVGDVVILQWGTDAELADDKAIRARLSQRDRWLAEVLEAPLAGGWNAKGETEASPVGAQPHPPLTLYSPPLGVGYKAVHSAEGDQAVRETLRRVGRWIADKKIDDGTPVSDVIVIAESRQAVDTLRPLAQAEGIAHIVYAGEDGKMWNPYPEGEWMEPK